MEIYGPSPVNGPQSIKPTQQLKSVESETVADHSPVDHVDISPEADFVSQVHELPDVRMDRVNEIRAEIESGAYESDEKLDIAVGRLLDEIG